MSDKGKLGSLRNARDGLPNPPSSTGLGNPAGVPRNVIKLKAQMQGIELAIHELEAERNKGTIDFGRYLQLKTEYETRRTECLLYLNTC